MNLIVVNLLNRILVKAGYVLRHANDIELNFHADHYLRHNARRLEHLASLGIPVGGMSVLEVGAGIGDLSHYYVDRGCSLTITEVRKESLAYLKKRYPDQKVCNLDMENPDLIGGGPFDLIHCYGLLYHLKNPKQAMEFFANNCNKMLILETCVSFGSIAEMNRIDEDKNDPTQANSGIGCRPTRSWIFENLKNLFEYVYMPITQPNHEEFPLDWTVPEKHKAPFSRAIFIASREQLINDLLSPVLINKQRRHP